MASDCAVAAHFNSLPRSLGLVDLLALLGCCWGQSGAACSGGIRAGSCSYGVGNPNVATV